MYRRFRQWLACVLAIGLAHGVAAVRGQDYPATPAGSNYYVSENLAADNANLAARVTDLEAALKKIDAKAKADKEKAASAFTCTPSGRIQVDTAAFSQSGPYLNKTYEPNGVEFRRLYLCLKGTGFNVVEYKTEFDLAGTVTNNAANAFPTSTKDAKVQAKDVYLQINELPGIGHVRIGNFYEPFSIEDVSGDLVTTFMERGNTYLLAPDRHIGIMAFDHILDNENTTWWLGAFCSAGGDGGMDFRETDSHTAMAVTGRLTWLPWYDEATEGRGLLHLGVAGSCRDAWGNQFPLMSPTSRPEEAHLGQTYYATMSGIDYINELNTELLLIYGPLSFQTEYTGAFAQTLTGASRPIHSFYAYVSYFLTGENRNYDRDTATTRRVKPFENFFRVRDENGNVYTGKGAWEVAYRWSWIDYHDAPSTPTVANPTSNGSRFSNHTVGLNWYLNPYTRLMLNDVYSTEQQLSGTMAYLNTVEMRAQINF